MLNPSFRAKGSAASIDTGFGVVWRILIVAVLLAVPARVYGMDRIFTIEIRNVAVSHGKVYVAVFNSESTYKKGEQYAGFVLNADSPTLFHSLEVPEGEYVISAFQDINNNGKLDMNFLGIPKEPIGMSNYSGTGIPGGFERLKVGIRADNQVVIVNMIKF